MNSPARKRPQNSKAEKPKADMSFNRTFKRESDQSTLPSLTLCTVSALTILLHEGDARRHAQGLGRIDKKLKQTLQRSPVCARAHMQSAKNTRKITHVARRRREARI